MAFVVNHRAVASGKHILKRSGLQLKAPIHNPEKLICLDMDYADHCHEQNVPIPTEPILLQVCSSITDPGALLVYPPETDELDFEVEMAFVIGKKGKNIKVW